MINFIKKVIFSVPLKHYIKYYVLGSIVLYFLFSKSSEPSLSESLFGIITLLLFPFTMLVWDSIIDIFMPKHIGLWVPFIILIPFMIFKYMVLFMLSILIAPVGILYLSYKVMTDEEYSLSDITASISKNRLFRKKVATEEA